MGSHSFRILGVGKFRYVGIYSLRKHPFLLALRRWGRLTSPAAKSEEKRMFSQAKGFKQDLNHIQFIKCVSSFQDDLV